MGGCARRGTRGDYDYHANITLKQIGMFDRTIVRLELWFERNPQEPGGPPSLNDAWRACSINERSPSGVRAVAKATLADPGKI